MSLRNECEKKTINYLPILRAEQLGEFLLSKAIISSSLNGSSKIVSRFISRIGCEGAYTFFPPASSASDKDSNLLILPLLSLLSSLSVFDVEKKTSLPKLRNNTLEQLLYIEYFREILQFSYSCLEFSGKIEKNRNNFNTILYKWKKSYEY